MRLEKCSRARHLQGHGIYGFLYACLRYGKRFTKKSMLTGHLKDPYNDKSANAGPKRAHELEDEDEGPSSSGKRIRNV